MADGWNMTYKIFKTKQRVNRSGLAKAYMEVCTQNNSDSFT